MAGDSISRLQAFIDDRWSACRIEFYPRVEVGPRVDRTVTEDEAAFFLAAVTDGGEPAIFVIDDQRRMRSDRRSPRAGGIPSVFNFFEEPGRVRLETIVQVAAVARLRDEFGWPRENLVFEAPPITNDAGAEQLSGGSLDILCLEVPHAQLPATMSAAAAACRVGVEAKGAPEQLDRLLHGMQGCRDGLAPRGHSASDHKKCLAIELLRPRHFLGVAAAETWRLFRVEERDGRVVLGPELSDVAAALRF